MAKQVKGEKEVTFIGETFSADLIQKPKEFSFLDKMDARQPEQVRLGEPKQSEKDEQWRMAIIFKDAITVATLGELEQWGIIARKGNEAGVVTDVIGVRKIPNTKRSELYSV